MYSLSQQQVRQVVAQELESGERLLWAGRPRGGVALHPVDFVVIPFAVFVLGFSTFWVVGVYRQSGSAAFAAFGIPFVLMGVYMLFGRLWMDARQRANTFYGLTDQRVMIISGAFTRRVRTLPLAGIDEMELLEAGDRSGTILFGPYSSARIAPWISGWPGIQKSSMLERIEDARQVYEQIRKAQHELVPR